MNATGMEEQISQSLMMCFSWRSGGWFLLACHSQVACRI